MTLRRRSLKTRTKMSRLRNRLKRKRLLREKQRKRKPMLRLDRRTIKKSIWTRNSRRSRRD
jgi:hypothetical protein